MFLGYSIFSPCSTNALSLSFLFLSGPGDGICAKAEGVFLLGVPSHGNLSHSRPVSFLMSL